MFVDDTPTLEISEKPAGVQPGQRVPGGSKGKERQPAEGWEDETEDECASESDSEGEWGGSDGE